jgi:hypothetical protein
MELEGFDVRRGRAASHRLPLRPRAMAFFTNLHGHDLALRLVDGLAAHFDDDCLVEFPHEEVAEASRVFRPSTWVGGLSLREWFEVRKAACAAG